MMESNIVSRITHNTEILNIPLDRIRILNPRSRDKKVFAKLVESIASIGLKRPVTVIESPADEGGPRYQLICGQGRYEAMKALGEQFIPCMVVEADESDRYLVGLVENIARKKHSHMDLLNAVRDLEQRGYSITQISEKINLDTTYIRCVLHLLKEGEARLINAVEKGKLSIVLASKIARLGDAEIQQAMADAYAAGTLKGEELLQMRMLVATRQKLGKGYGGKWYRKDEKPSQKNLLRAYQTEVRRQQLIIKKADLNHQRLLYILSAMKRLISDDNFRTLLRAESITDMPTTLAEKLREMIVDGRHSSRI